MTPRAFAAVFAALFVLSGCGTQVGRGTTPDPAVVVAVTGQVAYEARTPTPRGASIALERRPARFVRVELLRQGSVVASGATDAEGRFALQGPGADSVRAVAEIDYDGHRLFVGPDQSGRAALALLAAIPGDGAPMELLAAERDPAGAAGAFHILDTNLRGSMAVRAWTGERLPPAYVYWQRGGTTDWSYYRGRQGERYIIELLGGEPGRQAVTDTDEHDEEIILHEFGHFVMDVLTTDSSPGGTHPTGTLIDPGLAWEEGRATWFAAAVQGAPYYRDTVGLEPQGQMRVAGNLEGREEGPRGIGSEAGVSELLWDLADGAGGLADFDGDPVALGPGRVLELMRELSRDPGAFPCVATFLQHVVDNGGVSAGAMLSLVSRGGHPLEVFPNGGPSPWPVELALGVDVAGKVDSISSPAPSGGPPRPGNGVDAVRTYRVRVARRGFLEVKLSIHGTGRGQDGHDLDLELRSIRANLLESSLGEGPTERVARIVEPGFYVITVRDGGGGSDAGYTLSVALH